MPPKTKFTKDGIINAAFELVRSRGVDSLSARSLAKELGSSTAPIFSAFAGIDEVRAAVIDKAKSLYAEYLREGMTQATPFKGAGLSYIRFSKDEPQLFKLLFMPDNPDGEPTHFLPSSDDNFPAVLEALHSKTNISEENAKKLYNHLSVYVYGLAVLNVQGCFVFTDDDIDGMLTEVFTALKKEMQDE